MAVSYVQSVDANGAGNTQTVAYTTNPTINNGLVLFIGCTNVSATVTGLPTDTNLNTYVLVGTETGLGFAVFCYYVKSNSATHANTVSATVNSSGGFLELKVYEVSPGAGNNQILFDQKAIATSSASSTVSVGPTGTLANASEFCAMYAVISGSSFTASGAWSDDATLVNNAAEYKVVTATTAITGTGTTAGTKGYTGIVATFYGAVGGSVPSESVNPRAYSV